MRWKVVFFFVVCLAALQIAAAMFSTPLFNHAAVEILRPAATARAVAVDLFNGQASFYDVCLPHWETSQTTLVKIRNVILRWEILPLLNKQWVLREISVTGATLTIPVHDLQDGMTKLLYRLPGEDGAFKPLWPVVLSALSQDWVRPLTDQQEQSDECSPDAGLDSSGTTPRPLPGDIHKRPYWLDKQSDRVMVHYPSVKPRFMVRDIYCADGTVQFDLTDTLYPPLPSLTNVNCSLRNIDSWMAPVSRKKPPQSGRDEPQTLSANDGLRFVVQARIEGSANSYVKAEGYLVRSPEGIDGECQLSLEGLNLAAYWPWINPSWIPGEFAQFHVVDGTADLFSRIKICAGNWNIYSELTLKKLKIQPNPAVPSQPVHRASPKLVIDALNSLGEFKMRFSSANQWKKEFEENVMRGVRNLIRKSIGDALKNLTAQATGQSGT